MDFPVIVGPPDEIVQWKYIEEVRPRETGKRREKPPAPPTPRSDISGSDRWPTDSDLR